MKQSNEFIFLHVTWGRISLILMAGVLTFTIALAYRGALPASAAGPWYVAPGGSDGNSCLNDGSPCATINGAIGKASAGDTIYVATGMYTSSSGDEVVLINKSITLSGGWNSTFTVQEGSSILNGDEFHLGVEVGSGVTAAMERFNIQGGSGWSAGGLLNEGNFTLGDTSIVGNTAYDGGNGVYNSGSLTMTDIIVQENNTSGLSGSGIYNLGRLFLSNSTISSNEGYGINNRSNGRVSLVNSIISDHQRSGIYNTGEMTVTHSTVSYNSCPQEAGGGILNSGSMVVESSTVQNNICPVGGGIYNIGTLEIINSTISGNQAYYSPNGNGGGIYNIDNGTIYISNSTISNNSADNGGGVYNYPGSLLTMQNTLLAGNTALLVGSDCWGANSSAGYNLIGNTSGCTFSASTGDLLNTAPRLFSLIDSPGYHPLLRGSRAINAGNPSGCTDHLGNPLDTDQRGVARVGRCDIGSYEYDPANDPLHYVYLPFIFEYFCSDFFDDFSNPSSGWLVGEDDVLRAEYLSGEYRVLVKQTGSTLVFSAPTCNHQNYILEVDGRWGGNPGESYGLIFGIVGDFEQFYTLEVYPDVRGLALYRYVSGTWSEIWSHTDLAFIWDENHLKLTRNGDAIDLEVNGTTIFPTFYDSTITGMTGVGLIVSSFSDLPNADARFDNFSVSKVSGSVTVGNRQNGNAGSAEPQASFRMLENAESAELESRSPER